jgi:uncharacterized protein YhfF
MTRKQLPAVDSHLVKTFMAKISSELQETFPTPSSVVSFGGTLDKLIPLMNTYVLSGKKRGLGGFPAPIDPTIVGDVFVAVDTEYAPAILLRVLARPAVTFHEVTGKFVFEEGHPELTAQDWIDWHQKYWEKTLDHDGTPFGNGVGRKVSNLVFEVIYPRPVPIVPDSEPVKSLLELIERSLGLKIAVGEVKEIFDLGEGNRFASKRLNSLAVEGKKSALIEFSASVTGHGVVGDYAVGLGQFGEPYLLVKITKYEEKVFEDVEQKFVIAEDKEGFQQWKSDHTDAWNEKGDNNGALFGDGTGNRVLCRRFEVVWPKVEDKFP